MEESTAGRQRHYYSGDSDQGNPGEDLGQHDKRNDFTIYQDKSPVKASIERHPLVSNLPNIRLSLPNTPRGRRRSSSIGRKTPLSKSSAEQRKRKRRSSRIRSVIPKSPFARKSVEQNYVGPLKSVLISNASEAQRTDRRRRGRRNASPFNDLRTLTRLMSREKQTIKAREEGKRPSPHELNDEETQRFFASESDGANGDEEENFGGNSSSDTFNYEQRLEEIKKTKEAHSSLLRIIDRSSNQSRPGEDYGNGDVNDTDIETSRIIEELQRELILSNNKGFHTLSSDLSNENFADPFIEKEINRITQSAQNAKDIFSNRSSVHSETNRLSAITENLKQLNKDNKSGGSLEQNISIRTPTIVSPLMTISTIREKRIIDMSQDLQVGDESDENVEINEQSLNNISALGSEFMDDNLNQDVKKRTNDSMKEADHKLLDNNDDAAKHSDISGFEIQDHTENLTKVSELVADNKYEEAIETSSVHISSPIHNISMINDESFLQNELPEKETITSEALKEAGETSLGNGSTLKSAAQPYNIETQSGTTGLKAQPDSDDDSDIGQANYNHSFMDIDYDDFEVDELERSIEVEPLKTQNSMEDIETARRRQSEVSQMSENTRAETNRDFTERDRGELSESNLLGLLIHVDEEDYALLPDFQDYLGTEIETLNIYSADFEKDHNQTATKDTTRRSRANPPDRLPRRFVKSIAEHFLNEKVENIEDPAAIEPLDANIFDTRKSKKTNTRLSNEIVLLIEDFSNAFFENQVKDLIDFADHGKRKTINVNDIILLIRRSKILQNLNQNKLLPFQLEQLSTANNRSKGNVLNSIFSLANDFLPLEQLNEVEKDIFDTSNLGKSLAKR